MVNSNSITHSIQHRAELFDKLSNFMSDLNIKKNAISLKIILRERLFKEFLNFASSTVIFQISRVLVELMVAGILGPTIWGVWNLLNISILYRGAITFGIDNGMSRELPILLGKGKLLEAESLNNSAFTAILIISMLACALFLIILRYINEGLEFSYILMCILFMSFQGYHFYTYTLKCYSRFDQVSAIQAVFSLLFPLITIPLSYLYSFNGFLLGYSIALIVSCYSIFFKNKINFSLNINYVQLYNLIKIGFPIMLVGISYAILNTVDRWMISLFLGVEELGYYSMSIIVFSALILLPRIISQQIYPRMAYNWGADKSIYSMKALIRKQSLYSFYLIIPISVILYVFTPLLIRMWLPEYINGIDSARFIILGAIFMPLSAGWGNFLNIINKQIYYLYIIIIAIVINIISNFILIKLGYGIEGVAWGTVVSYCFTNVMIFLTGNYFSKTINNEDL